MVLVRVGDLPGAALVAAAEFHARVLPAVGTALADRPDCLTLVFPLAGEDHRGWRLAALQGLAREHAPLRVNGVESAEEAAIAAAEDFLVNAPGVTGQYLPLDAAGASGAL